MARQRVETVTSTALGYPEQVRAVLPDQPSLDAIGKLDLLTGDAIGVCGSRDASDKALDYAYRFGQICAEKGVIVVSGYARGVDRQAHKGSLEAGGKTIAVLPEGIDAFRIVRELKPFVDLEENFLAVSMFEQSAVWKPWRAMARNKLIVGLSSGLLVVEAREKGGTIDAARECARQHKPLWAIKYPVEGEERAGNAQLLRQEKALPLESREDLEEALEKASQNDLVATSQVPLLV